MILQEIFGSRINLVLAVATADLVAFTSGMMLAWSSSTLEKLGVADDDNPLGEAITPSQSSWIGAVLTLGAAIGPFPFGYLQDKIGRKYTLIGIAIPFAIAYIIGAFATNVIWFYILRAVAGLGLGGGFTVLPTYLAEVSDSAVRGMVSTTMNVFICTGLLASYCIGPYTSIMVFNIIAAIFPIAFIIIFFLFCPDTPHYFMKKDNKNQAESTLILLRSRPSSDIQAELKEIEQCIIDERKNTASFLDIFNSKGTIKAFIISVSLVIFQQLSGINVVLFYAQTIFESAGTDLDAAIPPIIIGAVQLVIGLIVPLVADRLGRKVLLLVSTAGVVISEVPLGVYFYLKDDGADVTAISFLPILTLVVYIMTYGAGIGPLPWTVMSEVFPSNIKSAASSFTSAACWTVSFIITFFFESLSNEIGIGGSFWIFAGCSLVGFVFILFVVPETKGKSFKEIQEILNS